MYLNKELFSDFLTERDITWLGIDFSKAAFTKKGFGIPYDILQLYFNEWNMLIISDQKKYDIRICFRKPVMNYNLSLVKKSNKLVKNQVVFYDFIGIEHVYTEDFIKEYIAPLAIPSETKYSLMFIVESFDQNIKTGVVWVVLIYSKTSEVVLCEKFMENPSGFNTKNYWARVFYNIFFKIQKSAFPRWENYVKGKICIFVNKFDSTK